MKNIVEQAKEIRRQTTAAAQTLPDDQALNSISLFDEWGTYIGTAVSVKQRVRHGNLLYECAQAHTPQANWSPDATPALWKRVSVEEWPEWIQPTGAHDAYEVGAKVAHKAKKWVNTHPNNAYEPGVYGWTEQS